MEAMKAFIMEHMPLKFKMGIMKLKERVGEDLVQAFFDRLEEYDELSNILLKTFSPKFSRISHRLKIP